ncbi:ATP-binding cassette domain-containing protein [Halobellus ruber]|uniref:ABC transporter ATP-binding protein n=1 Tax=Halobellus ruber TaxID=2761102 RepID=A0A7J9SF10_9EURY|nr:ABC transporter ATP-binding protein [Halobellus ruber]
MSDAPLLEVEDLRKKFGGITAVDGVSFELEEGKITGLIGPNGAGKTTTFNLLSGFYKPTSGTVRFKGTDTQEIMRPSSAERSIWTSASATSIGLFGLGVGRVLYGASPGVLAGGAVVGAGAGVGLYLGQGAYRNRSDDVKHSRPFQLAQRGMIRTFQITRELTEMTVLENLLLAPQDQTGENLVNAVARRDAVAENERELRAEAEEIIDLLELDHLRDEEAGNLSGGQRKLLELGRVLMLDPDLVLLDEPVAGVNPALTDRIMDVITSMRDEGYGFCIVEHEMDVIMEISDRIVAMAEGQKIAEGPPEEIQQNQQVLESYLGG